MTAKLLLQCKTDRRRFIVACAASILLHAFLFFALSLSVAPKTRGPDFVLVSIASANSARDAGGAQRVGDAMRKPASPRARPSALGAVGQVEARPLDAPPPDAAPKTAPLSTPRVESDAAAIPRAPASRPEAGLPGAVPEGRAEKSGAAGGAAGAASSGGTEASGDPSAELASMVSAAIEARKTYPEAARRRGAEGLVRLTLRVSGDGRLIAAKLASSSGSTLLDRAALDLASSVFPVDNIARKELELVMAVAYSLKH